MTPSNNSSDKSLDTEQVPKSKEMLHKAVSIMTAKDKEEAKKILEQAISHEYTPVKKPASKWLIVTYIFVALLSMVLQSASIHYTSQILPFWENIAVNNMAIFIAIAIMTMYNHQGRLFLHVVSKWKMFIRCFIGLTNQVLVILTLKYFSLFVNQAFTLVPNIMVALVGLFVYKEKVTKKSKMGLILGSMGIVYLLFSAFSDVHSDQTIYLLYPTLTIITGTLIFLYVKELLKTDSNQVITFYFSCGLFVGAIVALFLVDVWQSIFQWDVLLSLFITAISGTTQQIYRNKALENSTLSLFAALNPFSLVFTVSFGYLVFGEIPASAMVIAAIIIVIAGYIVVKGQEDAK